MTTPRDDLAGHQWRCAGCGKQSPDRSRSCDCPTNVVLRGREQAWKVDDEAIAGLIERLRDPNAAYTDHSDGDPDFARYMRWLKSLGEEAATALDSLQARVKELEAERDVLESSHRTVGKHLADEGERRIRAEQERDEAYERAVQAIRGASSLDENGYIVTKDAAIKAIRRLAAGAEKEKRE